MNFNAASHLAAVQRSVSLLERDGQAASAVTLYRTYAKAVADLWDALTNGERILCWFAPVSGDLELGGRYQVEGNAGGVVTACELLSSFALTWEFAGDVSWVEVTVSEEGDSGARLTLTHTAILSEHWETYGPGAVGVGWEMGFLGLALHLERPAELPQRLTRRNSPTSAEGRAFITGSSEGWAQAAAAAGTEPEVANAAAGRTTAFYTGEGG